MARRQHGEGSVFQRKDGRWVGALDMGWLDGKRKRKVVYGKSARDAARKLSEVRREWETHGTVAGAGLTVEGWLTRWLDTLAADATVAPSTLAGYRSKMAHVADRIGKRRLNDLDAEHVRGVYRWLAEQGRAKSYIEQTHRILCHAVNEAERERRISRNVMTIVRTPKVGGEKKPTKHVTLAQLYSLRDAIAGDRLESRWMFGMLIGARQGEIIGMGWEDVDLETGGVTIARALQRQRGRHGCGGTCGKTPGRCPARTGGGLTFVKPKSETSGRWLPLQPYLLESLRARHAQWQTEEHPDLSRFGPLAPSALVWGWPNGLPRDGKQDWKDWAALLKRSGIPHMGTHSSRHGVATLLSDLGMPAKIAQAILGHADASLTMRVYTHADDIGKRRALDAIESAIYGQPAIPSADQP